MSLLSTSAAESAAWTKVISGGARNDKLKGTTASELLDGRAGADTMIGGRGDDTYVVDNRGDLVVERAGDGVDTIRTSVSDFILPANVENLTFSASTGANLIGNSLDNTVRGGSGNDLIDGAAGADVLFGGGGADVFLLRKGEASGDRIMDFSSGDLIRLEGFGTEAKLVHQKGDIWSISWDGGAEVIQIAGITSLEQSDYHFI